jgi:hypothetical protein
VHVKGAHPAAWIAGSSKAGPFYRTEQSHTASGLAPAATPGNTRHVRARPGPT